MIKGNDDPWETDTVVVHPVWGLGTVLRKPPIVDTPMMYRDGYTWVRFLSYTPSPRWVSNRSLTEHV